MKLTTTVATALSCLVLVGCNQLNRVGSQAVVFDTDPFAQLDQSQTNQSQVAQNYAPQGQTQNYPPANQTAQHQQYAEPQYQQQSAPPAQPMGSGRVSVGNLSAAPATYGNSAPTPTPPAVQGRYTYSPPPMTKQAPAVTKQDFAPMPSAPSIGSSPAQRAAEEAAAMLASQAQPQYQQTQFQPNPTNQVQQVAYEAAAAMPSAPNFGSSPAQRAAEEAAAMLASRTQPQYQQTQFQGNQPNQFQIPPAAAEFGPDPFQPQAPGGTPNTGVVPMPPEAHYDAVSRQFELTEADLAPPTADVSVGGTEMYPGTNIPRPSGRVSLSSLMPEVWQPNPAQQPAEPIATQPVFTPPATEVATPVPAPVTQPIKAAIQDSTNQSKWRAVRRQ